MEERSRFGSFQDALDLTNFGSPVSVAAVDWNRDNHVDLVVANPKPNAASVDLLLSLAGDVPARGFVAGNDKVIKLGTNTPWCAQTEPIGSDFAIADIVPGSIELVSPGTGSVSRIPASGAMSVGDRDQNNIQDITVCFNKTGLRSLFSGVTGKQTVLRVAIEGGLTGGRRFHAPFSVTVAPQGGTTASAVLSPNPFNPSAALTFGTTRSGLVSVTLLDVSGRAVRRILDRVWMAAGDHRVRIDGKESGGAPLASGIYVYRIETTEGITTGRAVIVK
jgi:flagellar hook capping protein FlgD